MGELVGLGEVVARWQARLEGCDVGGGVCGMAMLVVEVALAVVGDWWAGLGDRRGQQSALARGGLRSLEPMAPRSRRKAAEALLGEFFANDVMGYVLLQLLGEVDKLT